MKRVGHDTKVGNLTPSQLRAFVYDDSIQPPTQKSRYRHSRAILRWADQGALLDGIEEPRTGKKLPKAVREGELDQICQAIVDDYQDKRRIGHCRFRELLWLIPTFRFAYFTGLRGSELGRLRWRHIDLARSRLTVLRQKSGNESTIPLIGPAEALLRGLNRSEGDGSFVFHSPRGDAWERSARWFREQISRQFATYRDEAEVRSNLTLHGLRHGFATRLAENGASAIAIKRAMRHSSVQTSMKYIHMANETLKTEIEDAF